MHPTTDHVLALLLAGNFLSGEELAHTHSISRAAIWKHIAELRSLGFTIEAITGKGYKLVDCPDTMHQALVHREYTPRRLGKSIDYLEECASTNAVLKQVAERSMGGCGGLVIVSDRQTAGRGRRGRTWSAASGEALLFSVLLYPPFPPSRLHGITLLAGVAVVEALASFGVEVSLKWPNDVYLDGRKLCGILAETSAELDHTNYVVLGIGLNVSGHPTALDQESTDLSRAGVRPKRAALLARILASLEDNYELYLDEQLEFIHSKWRRYSHTLGRRVTAYTLQGEYSGIARDISSEGALIITLDSGEEKIVTAGDVTVRQQEVR
ncbi:MAG: Bifunctional ligase/repressor BirA [Firmicutes bacterium]|nr:Bifunctional ligase/repressor BirA [Bacillota bacterium]